MLPVVGLFLGPYAFYEAVLAARVIRIRRGNRIPLATHMKDWPSDKQFSDPLTVATRAHGNYIEGVPLALLIAGVCELNGANKLILAVSLLLLFIGRVLHVENGLLRHPRAAGYGRVLGTAATQGFIVIWGLISVYLAIGALFA